MILLLPERRRVPEAVPSASAARALGRGDRLADGEAGELAQLQRHFELLPRGWPMAALTRELDAGDAGDRCWLRADPAYVRLEATGARLQGWSNLGLAPDECEELLRALRPLFGEAGMELSAPAPERCAGTCNWRGARRSRISSNPSRPSARTCSRSCRQAPKAGAGARCSTKRRCSCTSIP